MGDTISPAILFYIVFSAVMLMFSYSLQDSLFTEDANTRTVGTDNASQELENSFSNFNELNDTDDLSITKGIRQAPSKFKILINTITFNFDAFDDLQILRYILTTLFSLIPSLLLIFGFIDLIRGR